MSSSHDELLALVANGAAIDSTLDQQGAKLDRIGRVAEGAGQKPHPETVLFPGDRDSRPKTSEEEIVIM